MGDRTYHQGRIIASTAEKAGFIVDELDNGLVDEVRANGRYVAYTLEEGRCGATAELVGLIESTDPGAAYYCWEDPIYEYLGELFVSDGAGQRKHNVECDGEGRPRPTHHVVEQYGVQEAFAVDAIAAFEQAKKMEKAGREGQII
jgi:hypothetical protein